MGEERGLTHDRWCLSSVRGYLSIRVFNRMRDDTEARGVPKKLKEEVRIGGSS